MEGAAVWTATGLEYQRTALCCRGSTPPLSVFYGDIAQLVEQETLNFKVVGSSLTIPIFINRRSLVMKYGWLA
jgi:hypothetical protein